jgi:hypothetical protein
MKDTELVAGRELDALVAERVMGWVQEEPQPHPVNSFAIYFGGPPPYSTDIAAAWQVVERMREQEYSIALDSDTWLKHPYAVHFIGGNSGCVSCTADTAPLAICRAALKAVEP